MKDKDVRAILKSACKKAGSQTAWAEAHDMSVNTVNRVLAGTLKPTKRICAALGLKRCRTLTTEYKLDDGKG